MKLRNALKRIALIFLAIAFVSLTLAVPSEASGKDGITVTVEKADSADDKEETPEKDEPLPVGTFRFLSQPYREAAGNGTRLAFSQTHPLPLFEPPRS